jgi:hypothetical protein
MAILVFNHGQDEDHVRHVLQNVEGPAAENIPSAKAERGVLEGLRHAVEIEAESRRAFAHHLSSEF